MVDYLDTTTGQFWDLLQEDPETKGISLSAYLSMIEEAISCSGPGEQWIRVELSSLQKRSKGFWLLEFAETSGDGEQKAKVKGICRSWVCARVDQKFEKATSEKLQEGMKLLIKANCSLHPIFGIQLELLDVDPNYTLGDMEAKLNKIRERLILEGVYENNKNISFPPDFTKILLITPEQAAGLGDFMQSTDLLQDLGLLQVDYRTAVFESSQTGRQISELIQECAYQTTEYDAIFIVRGGGPKTSLTWLNEYQLARSVCDIQLPVIVGIGHERDHTILDEVARIAMGTPSKAATLIENTIYRQAEEALNNWSYIQQYLDRVIQTTKSECSSAMGFIAESAERCLQVARNNCRHLNETLNDNTGYLYYRSDNDCKNYLKSILDNSRFQINIAQGEIDSLFQNRIQREARVAIKQLQTGIQGMISEILNSSPQATLQKGFALTRKKSGKIVSSKHTAAKEPQLRIEYYDGEINTFIDHPEKQNRSKSYVHKKSSKLQGKLPGLEGDS